MTKHPEISPDIARVAARLRQTRADEDAGAERDGAMAGDRWARETATAGELEELAVEPWADNWIRWRPRDDNSIWEWLADGDGTHRGDQGDVEDWRDAAYTRGVLKGARDLWMQVRLLAY